MTTKPPLIVVIGSSNTDMVVRTAQLPLPGETVLGGTFSMVAGGKGANQAVAAARMGATVRFVACIGDGPFGDTALHALARENVLLDYVQRTGSAPPGVALIVVDDAGQNSIVVAPGSNGLLTPQHIEASAAGWQNASMIVLQMEIPKESVIAALRAAHTMGVKTLLNPAPAAPPDSEALALVDYLVANETEAATLLGTESITDAPDAARRLAQLGPRCATITMGSKGSVTYAADGQRIRTPGFAVKAVDSTAAGDCFVGALAYALCSHIALEAALTLASAAAAISVTRSGAQPSLPTRAEVEAFIKGARA